MMKKSLPLLLLLAVCGCKYTPEGVKVVDGFDAQRYLGTWYEIARIDNTFERGLVKVSATYSLNTDGSIRVLNKGFDPKQNQWKQVVGKARFVSGADRGCLKVSFFGPFYGGYNILDLDKKDYSYALVCGNNRSYLWILARQPKLPAPVLAALTQKAKAWGFDTHALLYVEQDVKP
jgi:apolipoprotein D and lipocalin family protein